MPSTELLSDIRERINSLSILDKSDEEIIDLIKSSAEVEISDLDDDSLSKLTDEQAEAAIDRITDAITEMELDVDDEDDYDEDYEEDEEDEED